MKSISTPIRLIVFLLLALLLANGLVWAVTNLGAPPLIAWFFGTGVAVCFLILSTQTLVHMETALRRILEGRPVSPLTASPWDPFQRLAQLVNQLVQAGRSTGDLRETLLRQVEVTAAQQERNRLARELHDSIKQQIFSIQMSAAAAETRLAKDSETGPARAAIADVRQSAQEALVEMNALLQQLSPAPLEKVGLAQAVRDQCEALGYRSGAQVTCEIGPLPEHQQLPPGAQEALFRIAQEALSNIARHARASQVQVEINSSPETRQVALEIRDNGQGFDPQQAGSGSGIAGMRERAARLGGQMILESQPGQGTRLQISLPWVEPSDEENEALPTRRSPAIGRAVATGMLGGILLLVVLWIPWFVQVFYEYPPSVNPPPPSGSLLGLVAAALVLSLTGWLAGRWVGSGSILAGAAAGAVAGVTGYGLVGGAYAAIRGASLLLDTGPVLVEPEAQAVRIIATALLAVLLTTHLQFWFMLLAGAGLGALGGWAAGRNRLALSPTTTDRLSFLILTPMLVSCGMVMLLELLLLPILEGSLLAAVQRGTIANAPLAFPIYLIQAITPAVLGIPGLLYLAAMRVRYLHLKNRLREALRLPSAEWEAFFLAGWSGLQALLGLLWMIQIQFIPGPSQIIPAPTAALTAGWVYTLLNTFLSLLIISLLAQIRHAMSAAGLQPPSMALHAALVAGALVPVLGVAGLWIGWLRSFALVALVAAAVLLLYVKFRGSEPASPDSQAKRSNARELAADTGDAWLGMIYGLVLPLLAAGSAATGATQIVLRMVPYLVHGGQQSLVPPSGTLAQAIDSITQRALVDTYLWHWGGFLGLLVLAGVMVGLALLAMAVQAGRR